MSVKALLSQLIFPPRCIACGRLLEIDRDHPRAFCRECGEGWRRELLLQCSECFLEYSKCRCMPYVLKQAGCARYIKLVPYGKDDGTQVSRSVILNMKRDPRARAFSAVAAELAFSVREVMDELSVEKEVDTVITFLPRRRRTQRAYGFDQARQLGIALSRETGFKLCRTLVRCHDGKEQKELTLRERQQNVRGAFRPTGEIKGKRVLLVDDVVTTGAGAAEAVRLLRRSGAAEVWVLSVGYTAKIKKNKKDERRCDFRV